MGKTFVNLGGPGWLGWYEHVTLDLRAHDFKPHIGYRVYFKNFL